MLNAVIMNENDTVVTVTKNVSANESVLYIVNGEILSVKATSEIPLNHKVAVKSVEKGKEVFKYGEKIGYATADINVGDHVHTNNLDS